MDSSAIVVLEEMCLLWSCMLTYVTVKGDQKLQEKGGRKRKKRRGEVKHKKESLVKGRKVNIQSIHTQVCVAVLDNKSDLLKVNFSTALPPLCVNVHMVVHLCVKSTSWATSIYKCMLRQIFVLMTYVCA